MMATGLKQYFHQCDFHSLSPIMLFSSSLAGNGRYIVRLKADLNHVIFNTKLSWVKKL